MSENEFETFDVIICGSGPAGASAAYSLAKNNFRVLVLEKARLPRYKTCGGGLTFKGLNLIPEDISDIIERSCYTAEINDYQADVSLSTKRERPMVSMTMRSELDFFLTMEAKKYGAEILENNEIAEIVNLNEGIEITIKNKNKKYFGKILIAADGAFSVIAKKYFAVNKKQTVPALEYEVYLNNPVLSSFENAARFDFGVVPNGYGWVFPKRDHLSVGVLSMKLKTNNLNALFEKYIKLLGIKNITKLEKHGFVIPLNPGKVFAKDRILLTGDAAGFADPVTGEGISFAIQSGQIAAGSVIKCKLTPEKICEEYNKQIKKIILPELRAAKFLAYFIYTHPKLRVIIFKLYGKKLSELITDVIMGQKKYSELVKNPMNYFKLLFKWSVKNKKLLKVENNIQSVQTSS